MEHHSGDVCLRPVRDSLKRHFTIAAGVLAATTCSAPLMAEDDAEDRAKPSSDQYTLGTPMQRTSGPNVFGTIAVPFGATPLSRSLDPDHHCLA